MSNIQIVTVIGPGIASAYADVLFASMVRWQSKKNNLRFCYLSILDGPTDLENWEHLEAVNDPLIQDSLNHGLALNKIQNHIQPDADYIIIVDADVAILMQDWDEEFKAKVKEIIDGVLSIY